MTDIVALEAANARRWANAKVTRNFGAVSPPASLAATAAPYAAGGSEILTEGRSSIF